MAVLVAVGAVLVGCSASNGSGATAAHEHDTVTAVAGVQLLGPADFEAAAAGRVLINVHIPDEGSLPGTEISLPYNEIDARSAELPADKATPLAIYCLSGNMSATAGRDLLVLGYSDVVELDGGMQAWQSSGRTLLPARS